jgi:DNA-binding transcriptional MerR regulator
MEWSIQDIARAAGTTSRTLRHYDQIGLLAPDRVGGNGYRYYSQNSLLRLQRILLLRELGLGLPAIAEILAGQQDTAAALNTHLELLEVERNRVDRQIASVKTTLRKLEGGEQLMPQEIFDGFDNAQYKDEVIAKYGQDSWEKGDRWWRSLSDAEQKAVGQRGLDITVDFAQAHAAGKAADGQEAQAIAQRHFDWLATMTRTTPSKAYFIGLGEMYVADARFTAHYDKHGVGTAAFVRDAMRVYAEHNLGE